ncbi:hypothetical protein [Allochromatium palmeri]|uniref:Uncharacterized protein n=1 Tax=Allochromatium palmeri TaxID=231048 RepID=A0A6N8EDG5_9GAMM|nr:hypothetical protein [Allochromatium palmeri]MTW20949.1 hypothetical protein [Allochromatium palmeri]
MPFELEPRLASTLPSRFQPEPRRLDSSGLVSGFLPAFRHLATGEIRLCQLADGRISVRHLLDSLPDDWIQERDSSGRPATLVSDIEPGFLRGIQFWTLENLAHPALDG